MPMEDTVYRTDALIAEDIDRYLETHQHKTMLRFITCGSVDDGKSTLIGRLLYDAKMIFEDQLATLEADSRRVGTQGARIDLRTLPNRCPSAAWRLKRLAWLPSASTRRLKWRRLRWRLQACD